MLPLFSQNQSYKKLGTALMGLCLSFTSFAQTTPIPTPASIDYPGILESLEKLISIDNTKFTKKNDLLLKKANGLPNLGGVSLIELDPDFLNSVILHSSPSYVKLASVDKCRFYDSIINDLLRDAEGQIKNVFITYVTKNNEKETALISKRDFINNVVPNECPETSKIVDQFQIKNLDKTIASSNFEHPTNQDQCRNYFVEWLNNPRSAYFCKLHEFMKEAKAGSGDLKDLPQRQAIAKILEKKLTPLRRDYLETLCENFDNEEMFCNEFLSVSFWTKVANGAENRIYAEDICMGVMNSKSLTDAQLKQCLGKMRKENDLCLYPGGRNQGLTPAPQCDNLATALNYSTLRSDFKDCPASSDQHIVTNMGRIILNLSKEAIPNHSGPCSALSTGVTFDFNKRFNNDEGWKFEACYDDQLNEKEVCFKTFFGQYGNLSESYTKVVETILQRTKGADRNVSCKMIDSEDFNPVLLEYKSGCFIIYERNKCFVSDCKHRIVFNDRVINNIRLKNRVTLDYFPTNITTERFSQHYLLTRDYRKEGRTINSIVSVTNFFKKNKTGMIHGVGCAEDLLPSFYKTHSLNQCSPLPFIIDGIITESDKTVFVTRTAIDTVQAPRLISWSSVFSAVKSYQRFHPLRLWTLYALD